MKRYVGMILTLPLLLTLAACAAAPTATEPPAPEPEPAPVVVEAPAPEPEPFPGKIAIITESVDVDEDLYSAGQLMVDKYGTDKIVIMTWPSGSSLNFALEETTESYKNMLAKENDLKALVINPAIPYTNTLVDKLLEIRDNIFIVYCTPFYYTSPYTSYVDPMENTAASAQMANLIMAADEPGMGTAMAEQAYKMGAETVVYYSFPRHMEQPLFAARHDSAKEKCAELGIKFVYAEAPDPVSDVGVVGAQQFILEDVPMQVAKYGKDTAFFSTNCSMQIPLIKSVVEQKAIYPQPCHPSPYHGFHRALGIEVPEEGLPDREYLISETARILKEKGMLGRVSTWPVPASMMFTVAGTEYAIKRLNGEVPQEGIDVAVLQRLMEDYAGVECYLRPYVDEDGTEYPHYLLVREDYLTYSEDDIRER